jgi:hypothetical protein
MPCFFLLLPCPFQFSTALPACPPPSCDRVPSFSLPCLLYTSNRSFSRLLPCRVPLSPPCLIPQLACCLASPRPLLSCLVPPLLLPCSLSPTSLPRLILCLVPSFLLPCPLSPVDLPPSSYCLAHSHMLSCPPLSPAALTPLSSLPPRHLLPSSLLSLTRARDICPAQALLLNTQLYSAVDGFPWSA